AVAPTGVRVAAVIANRVTPDVLPRGVAAAARSIDARALTSLAAGTGISLTEAEAAGILGLASATQRRRRRERAALADLRTAGSILQLPDVSDVPVIDRAHRLAAQIRPDEQMGAQLVKPLYHSNTSRPPKRTGAFLDGSLHGVRIVVVGG